MVICETDFFLFMLLHFQPFSFQDEMPSKVENYKDKMIVEWGNDTLAFGSGLKTKLICTFVGNLK